MNKNLHPLAPEASPIRKKIAQIKHFFSGRPAFIDAKEAEYLIAADANSSRHQALKRGATPRSVCLVYLALISVVLLLIWGGFAELDVIVRGTGQVVPSQRVQHIQNLEGGILSEILVHEGEQVKQGGLLARIDNESAGSQYREAIIRSLDYQATIARLEALIKDSELIKEYDPIYPPEVLADLNLMARHTNILRAMRTQVNSELQIIQLQANAHKREATEQEARKKQLAAGLRIAKRQRNLASKALQEKAYSELEFLNLEQRVHGMAMDITALEHSIPRLHIEAQEMKERLTQRKAEYVAQYSQEIGEIQLSLFSIRELLKAGGDKVKRTEMRSPVNGVIKRIYTTTVGGVVAPGGSIMDIVPLDDDLIIEARFSPADIAFLYPNLKAIVRLTAYDFAVYGSMEGTVETISADTLENNQGEVFYSVKIRTNRMSMQNQGRELPIIAGMQAEIDVVTGKKTVLDYILKPLLKTYNRALRE